jgi:multiple sugar transport system substrate-binding protein
MVQRVRPYARLAKLLWLTATRCLPYFELDEARLRLTRQAMPHPAGKTRRTDHPRWRRMCWASSQLAGRSPRRCREEPDRLYLARAQKLYVQSGSLSPDIRSVDQRSAVCHTIFEDRRAMSWRDELRFWPRPPIPQISEIISICGQKCATCCAVIITRRTIKSAKRAEQILKPDERRAQETPT